MAWLLVALRGLLAIVGSLAPVDLFGVPLAVAVVVLHAGSVVVRAGSVRRRTYVFDGSSRPPYDEDAPTAYGRTKIEGENAVREILPETGVVVRTGWLYGVHGRIFVRTMVRLAGLREYVDGQRGQPTRSNAHVVRAGEGNIRPAWIRSGSGAAGHRPHRGGAVRAGGHVNGRLTVSAGTTLTSASLIPDFGSACPTA